jgi:hypothetical protein
MLPFDDGKDGRHLFFIRVLRVIVSNAFLRQNSRGVSCCKGHGMRSGKEKNGNPWRLPGKTTRMMLVIP